MYLASQSSQPVRATTEDSVIRIVGANGFNNGLLAAYIQERTGKKCLCLNNYHPESLPGKSVQKATLVLFDCADLTCSAIEPWLQANSIASAPHNLLACFNVDARLKIEHQALDHGVRGVIYTNAPVDIYPRAAQALLGGELWYPRKVLQNFLAADAPTVQPAKVKTSLLTQREQTILSLMASGFTNRKIADNLSISPHTVRTHAYNLFKKINVRNRFQAAMWLSQNTPRCHLKKPAER